MHCIVLSGNEETAIRLRAALILGGMLGLDRELHGKPAGLRTYALVSLGAAVATIVVLESPNHSLAIDPNAIGRVVQGILTGIGFLGAGVILRDPKRSRNRAHDGRDDLDMRRPRNCMRSGYWSILGIAFALTAFALLFGQRVERLVERLFKRNQSGPTDDSV